MEHIPTRGVRRASSSFRFEEAVALLGPGEASSTAASARPDSLRKGTAASSAQASAPVRGILRRHSTNAFHDAVNLLEGVGGKRSQGQGHGTSPVESERPPLRDIGRRQSSSVKFDEAVSLLGPRVQKAQRDNSSRVDMAAAAEAEEPPAPRRGILRRQSTGLQFSEAVASFLGKEQAHGTASAAQSGPGRGSSPPPLPRPDQDDGGDDDEHDHPPPSSRGAAMWQQHSTRSQLSAKNLFESVAGTLAESPPLPPSSPPKPARSQDNGPNDQELGGGGRRGGRSLSPSSRSRGAERPPLTRGKSLGMALGAGDGGGSGGRGAALPRQARPDLFEQACLSLGAAPGRRRHALPPTGRHRASVATAGGQAGDGARNERKRLSVMDQLDQAALSLSGGREQPRSPRRVTFAVTGDFPLVEPLKDEEKAEEGEGGGGGIHVTSPGDQPAGLGRGGSVGDAVEEVQPGTASGARSEKAGHHRRGRGGSVAVGLSTGDMFEAIAGSFLGEGNGGGGAGVGAGGKAARGSRSMSPARRSRAAISIGINEPS